MWGHQLLLLIMTGHALWHYNETYSTAPVRVKWEGGRLHTTRQRSHTQLHHPLHRSAPVEEVQFGGEETSDPPPPPAATQEAAGSLPATTQRNLGEVVAPTALSPPSAAAASASSSSSSSSSAPAVASTTQPSDDDDKATRSLGSARGKGKRSSPRSGGAEPEESSSSGGGGLLFGLGRLIFGEPVPLGFTADLENMAPEQVRRSHRQLFEDLPLHGFDPRFKNPCWALGEPRVGGPGAGKQQQQQLPPPRGAAAAARRGGRRAPPRQWQGRRLLGSAPPEALPAPESPPQLLRSLEPPLRSNVSDGPKLAKFEGARRRSLLAMRAGGGGRGPKPFQLPPGLMPERGGGGIGGSGDGGEGASGGGGGAFDQGGEGGRGGLPHGTRPHALPWNQEAPPLPPRAPPGAPPRPERFPMADPLAGPPQLECLPYAYLLGMPKCGSSDLWERIRLHDQVQAADRKEVRFFTRGEFSSSTPLRGFMPPEEPLSAFTMHHANAAQAIYEEVNASAVFLDASEEERSRQTRKSIIVDGGPHTLWWSIQEPDGSTPKAVEDVDGGVRPAPIALLLAQLQPGTKLVVTLAEPVRRMYSDYFFLTRTRVARGTEGKSADEFHHVATQQVQDMHKCFQENARDPDLDPSVDYAPGGRLSVQAEQACAFDRFHFGQPGSGRIAIGLYHAFLHRWLQVYRRSQLLVVRLEDFNRGPRKHLEGVFRWLGLDAPSEESWERILVDRTFNEHRAPRDPIRSDSEQLLRDFYEPFNARLALLLGEGGGDEGAKGGAFGLHRSFLENGGGGSGGAGMESGEEEDEEWAAGWDRGAARFTWEDVWLLHSQDKPVLKSMWKDEEASLDSRDDGLLNPEDRLSAHHVHDPHGVAAAAASAVVPSEASRRAASVDWEEGDHGPVDPPPPSGLRGGGGGGAPRGPRGPRVGAGVNSGAGARPNLLGEGGRDGLVNLAPEMIQRANGATALCLAAMGLHEDALDVFLSTPGVDPSVAVLDNDLERTPLHCLGAVFIYGDSLRDSYLFSLLQNTQHWLDQVVVDPPVERGRASYGMRHVTHGSRHVIGNIAKRLLDAGANPNAPDIDWRTPLHYACLGGLGTMVEALVAAGADPNAVEHLHGQTPLHSCAAFGHADLMRHILDHAPSANPDLPDNYGNTARDIATAVGSSVHPDDLKRHLGWEKAPQRLLDPASALAMARKFGDGGWDPESLPPPYAFPDEDSILYRLAAESSTPHGGGVQPSSAEEALADPRANAPRLSSQERSELEAWRSAHDAQERSRSAAASAWNSFPAAEQVAAAAEGGERAPAEGGAAGAAAAAAAAAAATPRGLSPFHEHCEVDMLNASHVLELQAKDGSNIVFDKYVMMNRPVLLRGVNTANPAWRAYTRHALTRAHGGKKVTVSDIPYSTKFGSSNGKVETLGEYVEEMVAHRTSGANHPWYVFRGHPVPVQSDLEDSLVALDTAPIPKFMFDIFDVTAFQEGEGADMKKRKKRHGSGGLFSSLFGGGRNSSGNLVLMNDLGTGVTGRAAAPDTVVDYEASSQFRDPFVNMQWALGTKGSGAPVHFHNTAWNQLFYGRKHWYLLPPGRNLMGKKQVLDWVENDLEALQEEGFRTLECVQQRGDVLIVPELWGHAVLNTQDSVAVASEVRGSQFRIKLPRAYKDLSRGLGLAHPEMERKRRESPERAIKDDKRARSGQEPERGRPEQRGDRPPPSPPPPWSPDGEHPEHFGRGGRGGREERMPRGGPAYGDDRGLDNNHRLRSEFPPPPPRPPRPPPPPGRRGEGNWDYGDPRMRRDPFLEDVEARRWQEERGDPRGRPREEHDHHHDDSLTKRAWDLKREGDRGMGLPPREEWGARPRREPPDDSRSSGPGGGAEDWWPRGHGEEEFRGGEERHGLHPPLPPPPHHHHLSLAERQDRRHRVERDMEEPKRRRGSGGRDEDIDRWREAVAAREERMGEIEERFLDRTLGRPEIED